MMTKKEFLEKYKFSDTLPIDPTSKSIKSDAFSEAVFEFINGNFRGIAEVEANVESMQSVMICAEYTAFYFKTLLSFLHGRVYLKIRIWDDETALRIHITSDEDMPLTFEESNYLIKIARNAGMRIQPEANEIRLSLQYSDAACHGVYAIAIADGKRVLLGKFNEIFF